MAEPSHLPDYVAWLVAAEENNCSAWEFFSPDDPCQPPRMFWAMAGMILAGARADANETKQQRQQQKARQQNKKGR